MIRGEEKAKVNEVELCGVWRGWALRRWWLIRSLSMACLSHKPSESQATEVSIWIAASLLKRDDVTEMDTHGNGDK